MKNSFKLVIAFILMFLVIALAWSIATFYYFDVASALFWHQTVGIVFVSLIPLHVILHFKKLKKLAYECYYNLTGKKNSADIKKQIIKRLGTMKLGDFALWHGVAYDELENIAHKELKMTIHQEETLDELSKRANEEVFAFYLKIVDYKLRHTS